MPVRLRLSSKRRMPGWGDEERTKVTGCPMKLADYRARAAQAHEFITQMSGGYEAQIEQGGANLSGGQRQRLSIARTLVTDPAILILDDSTSAVDLETEARIQDALAAYADRTVVIVAQRISTALGADEIVVLDAGTVGAHGTHDELLASSTIYQEIFASQLGEPVS